jgi:hypothetical protein
MKLLVRHAVHGGGISVWLTTLSAPPSQGLCEQLGSEVCPSSHDSIHARAQIVQNDMRYLGITDLDSLTAKIDAAAKTV